MSIYKIHYYVIKKVDISGLAITGTILLGNTTVLPELYNGYI